MQQIVLLAALALVPATALAAGDGKHEHGTHAPAGGDEYAFGRPGDARKATRTVRIDMSDKMRFEPASLTVKQGETVKFVLRNRGKVMHEMVIGTMKELKEHAEAMKKHPHMEHDDPFGVEIDAGKTGTLVWQFTNPGTFHFGCLVPGHFEAGMIGQVRVNK